MHKYRTVYSNDESRRLLVECVQHGSCMYLLNREHQVTILEIQEKNLSEHFD